MQLNRSTRYTLYILVAVMLCFPAIAVAWEENQDIDALFKRAHTEGTFVLYDVTDHTFIGYNQTRAEIRYIPASTFKIANSLIGLSAGVVKSVDDPLPYKGPLKPFIAEWGHDMGLRKAIAISNVPIYQELARRIGLARMQKGLVTLNYGNKKTGDTVDRFWLDGPLKISALEQTKFLSDLIQEKLSLSKKIQKSVREILFLEEGAEWKLYGKSGWQNAPDSGVGWMVGWIETNNRFYVFALNIDINKPSDAEKRLKLVKESLELLGLIEHP